MSNYFIDGYFAKRDFGTDETTGLTIQVRATNLLADTETQEIHIGWKKCLVSSTGAVMGVLQEGSFKRFNGVVPKFTALKESQIGLGIRQMIEALDFSMIEEDLSNFPQILDQQ